MKHIKVVAFDCDGVMFDTKKANMAYYNEILQHFGRPNLTSDQFAYCHSHTADQSIAYLFKDEKSFMAAQDYRQRISYIPFLKYMVLEPYLKPLLEKLRPRYKTAIATNRSDTMDHVLGEHGLEAYFDLVVSSNDVDRPKPYPDPLIKIIEHFEIESYNTLYVGDSELDEMAAKAAGVPFVAYQNRSLSADFHIKSLKEIAQILDIKIA
ncbi:MAG: HAD family hydrolase [Deltaproteobacteria bacterium]|jgi:HAD superfamily hydrolase (TIGR01549 family)|nr:HAD family hydrolase [Deltaproteobacteria bacterium]